MLGTGQHPIVTDRQEVPTTCCHLFAPHLQTLQNVLAKMELKDDLIWGAKKSPEIHVWVFFPFYEAHMNFVKCFLMLEFQMAVGTHVAE